MHREGVVPQGLIADEKLLTEAQLEGEGVLPVMGRRTAVNAGGQRLWDLFSFRRRLSGSGVSLAAACPLKDAAALPAASLMRAAPSSAGAV